MLSPTSTTGLRHSYAREEFERSVGGSKNGWRIKEAKRGVAEKLGHGRPEVTDIYLHCKN